MYHLLLRDTIISSSSSFVTLLHEFSLLANDLDEFGSKCNWSQYYSPQNLVLALLGKLGKLAKVVQWEGDLMHSKKQKQEKTQEFLTKKFHEIADVTIYAICIASTFNIVQEIVSY